MIDKFFEKDFFPKIFKKNGKKFGTGSRDTPMSIEVFIVHSS